MLAGLRLPTVGIATTMPKVGSQSVLS
jgi:hypothetical protein